MNVHPIHNDTHAKVRYSALAGLLLSIVTLSVYWQVSQYDFVNFDDNVYVFENPHIRSGLTSDSLAWSFSFQQKDKNYWQPLNWLSHMLDVELYGMDPGRHHLTNVLFHIVNALLLFALLHWMTGARWRSAFVAALFALHPLNVESVAWIAARKNVLSTFFWILALYAYTYYTRRTSALRYLTVCFTLALGLLVKPMLVTLPFVLMLLDFWPLRRWAFAGMNGEGLHQRNTPQIVLEKVPLLLLSMLSVYISTKSVQGEGDVVSLQFIPMLLRIENALVSYVKYIGKMIWPQNLSVYYPFPDMVSAGQLMLAVAVLVSVSALAIWGIKRRPYLAVGWFWFLGTLVPVIGFMQVGLWPSIADRWAYVPIVGLFIIIAWSGPELLKGWNHKHKILAIAACAILLLLAITTRNQISHWANSTTLFKHAAKTVGGSSTPENNLGNAFIYNNLALALLEDGQIDEAHKYMQLAVNFAPDSARVNYNLGYILLQIGEVDTAIRHFRHALKFNSKYFLAHYHLAIALLQSGKLDDAISHYQIALNLVPDSKDVLNDLANVMVAQGRISEALSLYAKALRLAPDDPEIHNNLGVVMIRIQKFEKAAEHFRMALQLDSSYTAAQQNLKRVLKLCP
jgi:Flp pilus assembly protein TadD